MSMEMIQELRAQTGAGVMDVKKALDEAGGDKDKALELLRKRGEKVAAKKAGRDASEGTITSYVHMDKIGVLVELNCETDFVARTDDFKALGKDIALQIASMAPQYLTPEEVPADVVEKEREIYLEQIEGDKPEDVKAKIVDGKVEKFYKEVCLMKQPFFKDDKMSIEELITSSIGKLGENIQLSRFVRFSLDDSAETKKKTCC